MLFDRFVFRGTDPLLLKAYIANDTLIEQWSVNNNRNKNVLIFYGDEHLLSAVLRKLMKNKRPRTMTIKTQLAGEKEQSYMAESFPPCSFFSSVVKVVAPEEDQSVDPVC